MASIDGAATLRDLAPDCMRRLPLWANTLLAVDRVARRGFRIYEVLRDQLLLGRLDPGLYGELIERAYTDDQAIYMPGGARFEAGLFDWETMVLDRLQLPPRARILLAGAGGGRELAVLLDRGYDVVAFEPNEALLVGARAVATSARAAGAGQVVRASLEHLIEAAQQGTGPLAGFSGPFSTVMLGWGCLSHVTHPAAHVAVARAIRVLYPTAIVVISFLVNGESPRRSTRMAKTLLRAVGGGEVSAGLAFSPRGGVYYRFVPDEIRQMARESGYTVRHLDTKRDGYAILEPMAASVAAVSV